MGAHFTRDLWFCLGHTGRVGSIVVKKGIVASSAPLPSLTGSQGGARGVSIPWWWG